MSSRLTDEQYARTRISESPLRSLLPSQFKHIQEISVSQLNSHAYKNIQTVVAQLIILSATDNEDVTLPQIAEVISVEAKNIASAGIDYAYNVVTTSQQEEVEADVELEEAEEEEEEEKEKPEKETDDWRDREEENSAVN